MKKTFGTQIGKEKSATGNDEKVQVYRLLASLY